MATGTRRSFIRTAAVAGAAALTGCRRRSRGALVGFAQIDTGGVWRVAETESMVAAAAERAGTFELVVTDAQDQTVKQIGDVEDLLARRARAVFIAPREYDGLEPALEAARRAGVPVFLIDREAEGTPGVDYVSFLGSDFVEQGRRAAGWLVRATGGAAGVVELTGTAGSSVARDRADGFRQGIAGHPGVRVVASQTASFARSAAQAVLANVLQALGGAVTAVFAHNDEMALGAVQAVRAAGRRPGGDVTVVSIDGQRTALEAIVRGELGATVESNPRFGPLAFATLERHLAGEPVPPRIVLPDRLFDAGNAAESLSDAY
ncbi:ABC transporter substrate-binding protein [Gemmata sp.]|uniref:ABC transporter substrate-binding protein n=1 Tax=Gemmata sp. TaxID=1914242 RepID=UPI003F6EAEEF